MDPHRIFPSKFTNFVPNAKFVQGNKGKFQIKSVKQLKCRDLLAKMNMQTNRSVTSTMISTRGHSSQLPCFPIMNFISHNPLPATNYGVYNYTLYNYIYIYVFSLSLCEVWLCYHSFSERLLWFPVLWF